MKFSEELPSLGTLCETGERHQSQYRFVNLLESDLNKFPKSISTLILRLHRRPFEKLALKMKLLPYKSDAEIQLDGRQLRAENFKERL